MQQPRAACGQPETTGDSDVFRDAYDAAMVQPTGNDVAPQTECLFCRIIHGEVRAAIVAETEHTIAFLDHSPVFHGHVLLVPRPHSATLETLDPTLIAPLFAQAQRLSVAVRSAMTADGTWVSMNNTVSQSVPHLHVHIIPRRRKDGLRGFYWPRVKYANDDALLETALKIARTLE